MTISLPPKYVNANSSIVYNKDIPKAMFVTYIRLLGLAWNHNYEYTDPISMDDLTEILGVDERTFYRHLSGLAEMVPLRWESPRTRAIVFVFEQPDDPELSDSLLTKMSVPLVAVKDFKNKALKESELLLLNESFNRGGLGGMPPTDKNVSDELTKMSVDALQNAGAAARIAAELAATHPRERIEHALDVYQWAKTAGKAQGPGWLVRFLEESWPDPPGYVSPEDRCPACGLPWSERNDDCSEHRRSYFEGWETALSEAQIGGSEAC